MTLERLTQITSVGISSGITLSSATLTGVTTLTTLSAGGDIDAVNGTFSGNLNVTGGSVGIGTDNPAENVHIQAVRADVLIEGTNDTVGGNVANLSLMAPYYRKVGYSIKDSAGNEDFFIGRPYGQGDANPDLVINMTGTEKVRIKNNGNVGIGTDNPQYKLEVQGATTPAIVVRNTTTSSYSGLFAGEKGDGEVFAFQRLGSTNGGYGGAKAGQIWNYAAAPIVMGIGSTERLRITSDGTLRHSGGNASLGQGDIVAKHTHYTLDATTPGGVDDVTTFVTTSTTSNGSDYKFRITKREGSGGGSCYLDLGGNSDGSISFGTNTTGNGTERLRVDSSGRLLVGVFTQLNNDLLQTNGNIGLTKTASANQINFHGTSIEFVNRNATARAMKFYVGGSGGAPVAELSTAGTWTNASDIKNKENIENISYGIDTVKALITRQYTVKSNGANAIGFIAQEVQPIVPEVVHESFIEATQETHLGLDYGSLTAVLTKALQEAMERIETLEAEVAALKAAQ